MKALPYALGYLLPPMVVLCARAGGPWMFLPVLVTFAGVPVVDALSGRAAPAPGGAPAASLEQGLAFRVITWAWIPVQGLLVAWAMGLAASGALDGPAFAGLALGVGACTGTVGITYAHELVHRSSRIERALGEALLTMVSYPHFAIEHVYGHHRHVATPADPATARAGESFYRFLPRTMGGSLASAWRIERRRVRTRHGSAWHPANRMARYALTQALMYGASAWVFGRAGVALLAAQALVAVAQLEVINYVEHYGLERRELAPGRYEPVAACHSWDSRYRVTNWLLINLARHADHHLVASRRYAALDLRDQAPELPAGYGAMFALALVPPLWRRVMDPRVAAWREVHLAGPPR
ncbi:MAG: alkane 1-monooxygenase [Vicinamibacterales bacterium]